MGHHNNHVFISGRWYYGVLLMLLGVFLLIGLWGNAIGAGAVLLGGCLFIGGLAVGYYYAQMRTLSSLTRLPYMDDIMKVIQMQRHDFLNHLQVVSGLTQLRKTDRVVEYIASTAKEVSMERSITKFLPVESGLILLCWLRRLRDRGIPYNIDLSTDLSQARCGVYLAKLTSELLDNLIKNESKPDEILFRSVLSSSGVELDLIVFGYDKLPFVSLTRSRELARKMGGTLLVDQLEGMVRFRVLLPKAAAGLAGTEA